MCPPQHVLKQEAKRFTLTKDPIQKTRKPSILAHPLVWFDRLAFLVL